MIIISSSIPKSGSTLVWQYQRDMIKLACRRSGQSQLLKHSSYGGFINTFNFKVIATLLYLNFRFGDIVVKTHSKPTFLIKILIISGLAKATFCYRDPRDVILSAIDHGARTRKGLELSDAFRDFYNVIDAIPIVKNWLENWYRWRQIRKVLFIRYESLMENKLRCLAELSAYFGFQLNKEDLNTLYEKYEKDKISGKANFNKGTIQRYKVEMSSEELGLCSKIFQNEILNMRYEL